MASSQTSTNHRAKSVGSARTQTSASSSTASSSAASAASSVTSVSAGATSNIASDHPRFADITARLDEIAQQVKSKDTSLDECLDLFDEAIALGSSAVDLVDSLTDIDFDEDEALSEAKDIDAADGHHADTADDHNADAAPASAVSSPSCTS